LTVVWASGPAAGEAAAMAISLWGVG
jgi:hypothetical protein